MTPISINERIDKILNIEKNKIIINSFLYLTLS